MYFVPVYHNANNNWYDSSTKHIIRYVCSIIILISLTYSVSFYTSVAHFQFTCVATHVSQNYSNTAHNFCSNSFSWCLCILSVLSFKTCKQQYALVDCVSLQNPAHKVVMEFSAWVMFITFLVNGEQFFMVCHLAATSPATCNFHL